MNFNTGIYYLNTFCMKFRSLQTDDKLLTHPHTNTIKYADNTSNSTYWWWTNFKLNDKGCNAKCDKAIKCK